MGGSVGGGATGGTWSGGAGTWTNPTDPANATYTAGAAESGTVTLTLTTSGGSCGTTTVTKNITINPLATVDPTSVPYPSVCISSPSLTPFTQNTTGVTAISGNGTPGANGLPPGISANFNSSTGVITFSGTATTPGIYNYSIPITGGTCFTGLSATGTIEVSPNYTLNSVSSVSASFNGGPATITISGNPSILTDGKYIVSYTLGLGNSGTYTTSPLGFDVRNGVGTFQTTGIANPELTQLVITSIKKTTDVCTVPLDPNSLNNTTFFGICSAVFTGNGTFFVPANIYEVTIKVWGGGGKGGNSINGTGGGGGGGGGYSTITIPVTPGEPMAVYVGQGGVPASPNGGRTYVTRDSSLPYTSGLVSAEGGSAGNNGGAAVNPGAGGAGGNGTSMNGVAGLPNSGTNGGNGGNGANSTGTGGKGATTSSNNSTVGTSPGGGGGGARGNNNEGANGGNGIVLISYSCPDSNQLDCIEIIDDGTVSGTTLIRFNCNYTWTAPQGLTNFNVWVGAGGGGGGAGTAAGGGGAGGVNSGAISTTNPYGLPANSNFTVLVGTGGAGAVSSVQRGSNGLPSSVAGTVDGANTSISANGGGGGGSSGSSTTVNGNAGGSGGGGGAIRNNGLEIVGLGGIGTHGGKGGDSDVRFQGQQQAIAGGGGGGILGAGFPGNGNGNGTAFGGNGGNAQQFTIGSTTFHFGAGGGGLGTNFNGNEFPGLGGVNVLGATLGGNANPFLFDEKKNQNNDPDPIGQNNGGNGAPGTGSGGGAGYDRGGSGGRGVVYISFPNIRILPIDFLYFDAKYNPNLRTGDLKWATSKEWENSHFEIERAINGIKNWSVIDQVAGAGYSDKPVEYSYTDKNLPASGGNIFYRLKQVDLDGNFSYSVTRSIQVEPVKGASSWIIYPNPTNGREFNLELIQTEQVLEGEVNAMISTSTGQTQFFTESNLEILSEQIGTYLQTKAAGVYVLNLSWNGKSESYRIIKK
ncbi:T9SS type A sorting domain-containing protein [Algoriphagus boseongensis]